MTTSKRTFGVEIECGNEKYRYDSIARLLSDAEIPLYNTGYNSGVGCDGSGIEVRTPVLKGEEGYKALTRLMNFLNEKGCYVTRQDGMHTHVGAGELANDEELCTVLARTWYNNQAHIGRMVSSHRYGHTITGINVCARVLEEEVGVWGQTPRQPGYPKNWGPRYKAMSMYRVPHRNTVEFRLHEGCLDPVKAVAWVKFCQALLDFVVNERTVITCKTKTEFLRTLEVPEDAIPILSKRQKLMPANGAKVFVTK